MSLRTKVLKTKTRGRVETLPCSKRDGFTTTSLLMNYSPLRGWISFWFYNHFENLTILLGTIRWLKIRFTPTKRKWRFLESTPRLQVAGPLGLLPSESPPGGSVAATAAPWMWWGKTRPCSSFSKVRGRFPHGAPAPEKGHGSLSLFHPPAIHWSLALEEMLSH